MNTLKYPQRAERNHGKGVKEIRMIHIQIENIWMDKNYKKKLSRNSEVRKQNSWKNYWNGSVADIS